MIDEGDSSEAHLPLHCQRAWSNATPRISKKVMGLFFSGINKYLQCREIKFDTVSAHYI
jgi:hypothetical protein